MIWPEAPYREEVLQLIEKHDLITESEFWDAEFDHETLYRTEIPDKEG